MISWMNQGEALVSEEPLFRIQLRAKKDLHISSVLALDRSQMEPEAYHEDDVIPLGLKFIFWPPVDF